jgi:hypothetical protein
MATETPQVASITPAQVPTMAPVASAAGGVAAPSDIGQLMQPIIQQANQSVPSPYAQGVDVAEPKLKPVYQAQHYNENNQPISMQVQDLNRARRKNAVAGLANTIGQFKQEYEQKKQDELKSKLTDVMKYKTNAENAAAVIADPYSSKQTKAMAQKVLDANKKQLNAILSDPKNQKQLSKAMDISYVDPEKNKTPEVQALQKAVAEFHAAGPFKSDNPQEHAVAQAAAKVGTPQGPQGAQAAKQAPQQQTPQRSATPYADAAMAKDSPTVAPNPRYEAVLQQKDMAQKQLATMIPHFIDAESKAQLQAARDTNSATRLQFIKLADAQRTQLSDIYKLQGVDDRNKAMLQVQSKRSASELGAAQIRANATIKVAQMKDLTDRQKIAILKTGLAPIDKQISQVTTRLENYDKQVAAMKASTPDKNDQVANMKVIEMQRQMDSNELTQLQQMRTGVTTGNSMMVDDSTTAPSTFNTEIGQFLNSTTPPDNSDVESVGGDTSDESDNPDDYDQ